MPWSSNSELPSSVKDSLPEKAQTIWRKIANSALETYDKESTALATAWAGLRRAGWTKNKDGKWVEKSIESSGDTDCVTKTFSFEIKKSDTDQRLAFGWSVVSRDILGNEVWDLQNDSIDPDDLEALAYRYARFYRNVGELHINSGMGVMVESVVTTIEKQRIWGVPAGCMPVGWWTGFYISDGEVWEKVKNGTYRAFSIEGTAKRVQV